MQPITHASLDPKSNDIMLLRADQEFYGVYKLFRPNHPQYPWPARLQDCEPPYRRDSKRMCKSVVPKKPFEPGFGLIAIKPKRFGWGRVPEQVPKNDNVHHHAHICEVISVRLVMAVTSFLIFSHQGDHDEKVY